MIEELVQTGVNKVLSEEFPHLLRPAFVCARITKAQDAGGYYVYNLKILDKTGEIDSSFSEIPSIHSKVQAATGATVAVALLYGELNPFIIAEVV
jgi:hypothetical protein